MTCRGCPFALLPLCAPVVHGLSQASACHSGGGGGLTWRKGGSVGGRQASRGGGWGGHAGNKGGSEAGRAGVGEGGRVDDVRFSGTTTTRSSCSCLRRPTTGVHDRPDPPVSGPHYAEGPCQPFACSGMGHSVCSGQTVRDLVGNIGGSCPHFTHVCVCVCVCVCSWDMPVSILHSPGHAPLVCVWLGGST